MNFMRPSGINPFLDPTDRFLAEIAFTIQLPPSLHAKADGRYAAARRHLEASTFFADGIEHFYPQGSMAIDATISTRGTDDEYDIDIIAQLAGRFRHLGPLAILKAIEAAFKDYPVQQVIRQTRCITLVYSDRMHLDVSPGFRDLWTPDRQSHIMHAKGPAASTDDHEVPTNAYGFAEWYKARTPVELAVQEAFRRKWEDHLRIRADADVDEVPDQTPFVVKNMATLALQLLKRFRNIRHDQMGRQGRMAPSVLLAYYAARSASPGQTLTDALLNLCTLIIRDIDRASMLGRTLEVRNPTYFDDVFTDRWPGSITQQNEFASDLRLLVEAIKTLRSERTDPVEIPGILKRLFGDYVVTDSIRRIAKATGSSIQGATQSYTTKGGLLVPAVIAATPAAAAPNVISPIAATRHRFYGDPL
ncbi:nucleotidyltransferase [Rhizobium sp. LCM 4573]|uniref:nucleotidyltransferase domain-containing protein n=1 Tax=Rhizobium sp. LCM 4573 TaxID=1848291 RepID=UPI0008D9CD26|nr:nucleotidyltransferase [Rhizobium sp. LCM 4573]OHV82593.1 hypothetical protein LCM4573_16465 [Rhizobium sp. LCM 4573]